MNAGGFSVDLFHALPDVRPRKESLAEHAFVLRGLLNDDAPAVMQAVQRILIAAPLRHMFTPGGHRMSAKMSNCGRVGWVTDRSGYRYDPVDPETGLPWPALPTLFHSLAARAAAEAGFGHFAPDACLINVYAPGARMSLHQDKNERDFSAPIVSVSLGLPMVFLFGGLRRSDPTRRCRLEHGDIAVWGGPSRLVYHGVMPLADGDHPLTGRCRINLTFRQAL
jgi:DNA oxidative demethylase